MTNSSLSLHFPSSPSLPPPLIRLRCPLLPPLLQDQHGREPTPLLVQRSPFLPPHFHPSLTAEAPLNFYPTYKLDIGSNEYDTGPKKRIPSWTDRILFKPTGMRCLAYDSVTDIMISDHRPVYGSFLVNVVPSDGASERGGETQFVSESQVCRIM
jgi:hypothetical protein